MNQKSNYKVSGRILYDFAYYVGKKKKINLFYTVKYEKEKLIQINFSFSLSYNSILAGFTNSGTGAYRLIFSFFTG